MSITVLDCIVLNVQNSNSNPNRELIRLTVSAVFLHNYLVFEPFFSHNPLYMLMIDMDSAISEYTFDDIS